jgi:hypothetical protein
MLVTDASRPIAKLFDWLGGVLRFQGAPSAVGHDLSRNAFIRSPQPTTATRLT